MEETLHDKYGGFETIRKIVHGLYEKIGHSELLEPYFRDTDMERLCTVCRKNWAKLPVAIHDATTANRQCTMITLVVLKQK